MLLILGNLYLICQPDVVRGAADQDVVDVRFDDKLMHILVVEREF